MIDIAVEYPFMLCTRKAVGKTPSKWSELSEKQFIGISSIVYGKDLDYKFLSLLTGIKKQILMRLSPYQLTVLSEQIDFIGSAGSSHSDFIISEISCWPTLLLAPRPKMEGITLGQFIFIEAYYNDWSSLKQESALDKFIASVYLPHGEQFNNEMIDFREKSISQISIELRKAIAFNFSLIIFWLQKAYPLIFPESFEDPKQEQTAKTNQTSGWLKIFESLVGEDLINRDKYAGLPLHTVLKHMTRKYKENARH